MKPMIFNILLADDDEDDRTFFQEALSELGIKAKLTMMHDGNELIKYLTEDALVLPNLLFLDINMPKKNGMKVLEELRNNEKLKEIPVIMYSTSSSPIHIKEALDKGAHSYIKKASDFEELKKEIHNAIQSVGPVLLPVIENLNVVVH